MPTIPSLLSPEELDSLKAEQLVRIAAWTDKERPQPDPKAPAEDASEAA